MKFFTFALLILVGIAFVQADVSLEMKKCYQKIEYPCKYCTDDELGTYKEAAAEIKKCFDQCKQEFIFDLKKYLTVTYTDAAQKMNISIFCFENLSVCWSISGNILDFTFITTVLAFLF
ncbi:hypothetical protein ABPG74_018918 [Tetrahymena malaccensis]